MFTLDQIKESHSKVKSGADFPAHIQRLIQLGVTGYTNFVEDGHTVFMRENNVQVQAPAKYAVMEIASETASEKFKQLLKAHQQGQSDYPTFCKQSAETGIEKWVVDMREMTCSYYDKKGNVILAEIIPVP